MIKKLYVSTDGNELEYVRTVKSKTETLYEYRFTRSETKQGLLMTITEEQLLKNIKKGIFVTK